MKRTAWVAAVVVWGCWSSARAADDPSKIDHPLVKRYPGSEPMGKPGVTHDFDELTLVLGKVQGEDKAEKLETKEGRTYTVDYRNPAGRSLLEIYKNYEQGLTGAGFKVLYSCADAGCGADGSFDHELLSFRDPSYLRRLVVAKLARAQGDAYVQILVQAQDKGSAGDTQLEIVETKPMQTGLVAVDADTWGKDLGDTGHVALYGIYFDSGKSVVKPESEPTLKQVARLLAKDAGLKLVVVGHTDGAGELPANLELSRARAKAVVATLTGKHGVAAARLRADGVGPLAPIASNRTEEGRAKNRRVELIDLATH